MFLDIHPNTQASVFLLTREHLGQACFSQLLGPDSSKKSKEVGTSWILRTTGWWVVASWDVREETYHRLLHPHCESSVVALGTTKHSLKNMYVFFSLSSMNLNSSHSSLLHAIPLGITGQKGQTPANHWLWTYFGWLRGWRTILHFLVLKWNTCALVQ